LGGVRGRVWVRERGPGPGGSDKALPDAPTGQDLRRKGSRVRLLDRLAPLQTSSNDRKSSMVHDMSLAS
jgi:hypothetical protein